MGAIITSGQELSSIQSMASIIDNSLLDYFPYPFYLSIAAFVLGLALLSWGVVEELVETPK
ncbi:hypothetical protein RYX56_14395 [Alkalihalophilus lindianensis]|uniref:Uncharacterized protein n=1 Tax=Alkalihalophilus lindianensis TaxID=1630542 RepID=A0ABU3XCD7_9BACI|nr:hypothetical protein [Alkalihalophilus lindianensis]MDV2685553.1 hypothetical protein [Alkalihalophilus lindianensis]